MSSGNLQLEVRNPWFGVVAVFLFLAATPAEGLSETSPDLAECSRIEDNGERLKCYDHLAGRKPKDSVPALKSGEKPSPDKEKKFSYFSHLWELEPETRIGFILKEWD